MDTISIIEDENQPIARRLCDRFYGIPAEWAGGWEEADEMCQMLADEMLDQAILLVPLSEPHGENASELAVGLLTLHNTLINWMLLADEHSGEEPEAVEEIQEKIEDHYRQLSILADAELTDTEHTTIHRCLDHMIEDMDLRNFDSGPLFRLKHSIKKNEQPTKQPQP